MDKNINGRLIANSIKETLKQKLESIPKRLKLVVISVGSNEASKIYIDMKKKLCEEIGIDFENDHYELAEENELIENINILNSDDSVTAILVQLPLPEYLNSKHIIDAIDYKKDVDGLSDNNFIKIINKEDGIIPCTAYGIIKMLEYSNVDIAGKDICVVGRSRLVGLPTSLLLLNKGATVTMCHSNTANLKKETKEADIIISATGHKHLITKDMIKDDAIIIDVGIIREDRLYGDVDYDDVYDKVSLITPVPGGVGPMTVIMLINNIIKCYEIQNK
ncbi:MAG TPA: bifunctional 5,10-methylenetetrahydrofolate dehydrogenase/5,10-methenyltetrahydrofolate cyclohydrolase [Bacilli bacterium]|nr:bifunctional 5,10-methylenetetrahydrofolate dehydrogenase/5,10-methenyltetrahydrofolate cyclohydrolase [Bacilli bacterium]